MPYTLHPTPYTLHPTPYTLKRASLVQVRDTGASLFLASLFLASLFLALASLARHSHTL
jgi:hypothetical protein